MHYVYGESLWNFENRFTGWIDVDLSNKGIAESIEAGRILKRGGFVFDISFTSVLRRAIRTLWIVLDEMDLMWVPVKTSWRLNERHYGALEGLNKAKLAEKYGDKQVHIWRRGYDIRPPALEKTDERYPGNDPRYKDLDEKALPLTESLKDTVERFLPFWHSDIAPKIKSGKKVIVTAHGNSLRALIKYLENVPDDEIVELNIPTGIPLVYELDEELKPPEDGGLKYNPPHGGPADTNVTQWVEERANDLLRDENKKVRRIPYEKVLRASTIHEYDYVTPYVEDLQNVIDMKVIRSASLKMGVDPMGGSTLPFWEPIARRYGLNINVLNPVIDPTFGFMTLDGDGQIRMDCSSQYAMARLIKLKEKFDIAFRNDPDGDRHGIVTPSMGLMNPNHFLSVAVWYLFRNRPGWRKDTAIGKTFVTSSMIDRVAKHLGRKRFEVPVRFKWLVNGLLDGSCGFAGEESAGASLLRKNGTVWTTDKDGIISGLLAAEITARTGSDLSIQYQNLGEMLGHSVYERIDAPATREQQVVLSKLSPDQIAPSALAGETILAKLIRSPGNNAPIGGIKVVTENGWFAVRPSGTEEVYKIYAESFRGREHLRQIQKEAKAMIMAAFRTAGV